MSQKLQRLAVRMLYDPALVARVYDGGPVDGMTDAERAMLTAGPRAAWGADRLRSTRTLQALLEEYPASAAVTGLAPLHGFFASSAFHTCIQSRGRLVEACAFSCKHRLVGGLRPPCEADQQQRADSSKAIHDRSC